MCDPITAISLGTTALGAISSLTGAGKNKKQEYSAAGGQEATDFQNYLMNTLKQRMQQPRMVATVNPMQKNAMAGVGNYYGMNLGNMFQPTYFNPSTGTLSQSATSYPGTYPTPVASGGVPTMVSGFRTPNNMAPRIMRKI